MRIGRKAGGGATGKKLTRGQVVELLVGAVAALMAGFVGSLTVSVMLYGDAGVLGVSPDLLRLVAHALPVLQCALLVACAAVSARWGRRTMLLGGLAALALGATACSALALVAVPSIALLAIAGLGGASVLVSVAGAMVLTTTSEALLMLRASRWWWGLWAGAWAVGHWAGWTKAASLGTADWLQSGWRAVHLPGGWVVAIAVRAPGWRQAFALLALAALLLLIGACALAPRVAARPFRFDWGGVVPWTLSALMLGFVTVQPANRLAWVSLVALMVACLLQHIRMNEQSGVGGAIGLGGAPGLVTATCLAIWLSACGIAGLQGVALLEELPAWALQGVVGAASLLAAVAAVAHLQQRVAHVPLDDSADSLEGIR